MSVKLNFASDLDRMGVMLSDFAREQLPFAAALAMTNGVKAAQGAIKDAMRRDFDRPNRWTLNSTFVETATKRKLEANVHFKDQLASGVPAGRFLAPQIIGGVRSRKSHEVQLASAGLLPDGMALAPTRYARKDRSGNVSAALLRDIVASLTGGGTTYFAIVPGRRNRGGLPPGIYGVRGTAPKRVVVPLLNYIAVPTYGERLDFHGIAMRTFEAEMPKLLGEALERALRTARARRTPR